MKNIIIIAIYLQCILLTSFSFMQEQKITLPKKCTQLNFLPMPRKISCSINEQIFQMEDPCKIKYEINASVSQGQKLQHLIQLIEHQQYKTFKCRVSHIQVNGKMLTGKSEHNQKVYVVSVELSNTELKSAFTSSQQSYKLYISRQVATIKTQHYVGFVRALETFVQSISCNKKCTNCFMIALPIQIEDEPQFSYRGLLVDTSRHYIQMKLLKQTIDAMMYNKMNVFHWHIVDQDSFPLQLKSHPQIAQYAAFSIYEVYSIKEVKQFIRYAMVRGVRVIPEIDTPGHAASWAKSPQNNQVACTFGEGSRRPSKYKGPLDVTLDKTYALVKQVFKQIFELFPDPFVHLGGDQVELTCLKNKTQYLLRQQINESQIELQYRRKQKKILRQLNQSKIFIYWMYENITQIEEDDIMQWWGRSQLIPINVTDRKIIVSSSVPEFYIDMGTGNVGGLPYHTYGTWYDMYRINLKKKIQNYPQKDNVLGLQVTLWTETSNAYTHHLKIWIRTSSMAERAWTSEQHAMKPDFFSRLTTHQRLMNRRGIPTAPATNQQCQYRTQLC